MSNGPPLAARYREAGSASARATLGAKLLREYWIWLLALVVGVFLRVDQLASQIVGDDEWHSLIYVQEHGYGAIASHFGLSDICIPLTLLHRFLYETIGLSELALRALPLAAGLAALVVLPLLVRPLVGSTAAQIFALLLALFPLHVYFSRSVRPYSVSILLALISLFALERWLQGSGRRYAGLYIGCAAIAPWFHLTLVPFVFAPLGWELVQRVAGRGRSSGPGLWTLVAVGATAAAVLLLLVAPPLLGDWNSVAAKAGRADYSWGTWREASGLLSGTHHPLGIAVWFLAAVSGLVMLWRRQSHFVQSCAVASLAQIAAVLLVRPWIGGSGIVFVRYVLPVAVLLVLGLAVALAAWISARDVQWRVRQFVCVAVVFVWVAMGPLPAIHFRPNDWTNHGFYQFDYDLENSYLARASGPVAIPSFYRTLAAMKPGEIVIAEAPFHFEWHKNNFYAYQRIHRQQTIVGEVNELTPHFSPVFPPTDRNARFENAIPIHDIQRLRARGVRFVVLHLDVSQELPEWDPSDPPPNMVPVVRFFTRRCNTPYMRDDQLVVFDLNRCHL